MPLDNEEGRELAPMDADSTVVALLNKSEIDQQIVTAHKFPRSIKRFRDEVLQLATLNETVAEECSYALSRKDKDGNKKTIIGPSARFAEIVVHAWGNNRAGARVVDDRGEFVVAQGAFMDLEKNVAITYEVQRRITDSGGRRYKADMIGVTANAACSIAIRNAVLKGVPKALWMDLWEQARKVAVGDASTLSNKRLKLVDRFKAYGIDVAQLLAKVSRASLDEITLDDVEILIGIGTSIKDGETTPEEAFRTTDADVQSGAINAINESIKATGAASATAKPAEAEYDGPTYAELAEEIEAARKSGDVDSIDVAIDMARKHPDETQRHELERLAATAREKVQAKTAAAGGDAPKGAVMVKDAPV